MVSDRWEFLSWYSCPLFQHLADLKKKTHILQCFSCSYAFHVMSPNVFRAHSSSRSSLWRRTMWDFQRAGWMFLLFALLRQWRILKDWLLPASSGRGCTFSSLSALRGGVSSLFWALSRSSKQTRSFHKWMAWTPISPWFVAIQLFRVCGLPVCISLRVWLRKSWLHVVEWRERCQFFSLQNWEVWFRDRWGSVQAEWGALKEKRPWKRCWTDAHLNSDGLIWCAGGSSYLRFLHTDPDDHH